MNIVKHPQGMLLNNSGNIKITNLDHLKFTNYGRF